MSKESKKTRYHDCECGRKVPIDGVKVMRHCKPGSSEYCEHSGKGVPTKAQEKVIRANKLLANAQPQGSDMVSIKCMFPPCTTPVMVKAPPPGVTKGTPQHMLTLGGIPMCTKHGEWLNFYVWAQINIKLQAQQTKGGLILPGNKAFQAAMKEGVKP